MYRFSHKKVGRAIALVMIKVIMCDYGAGIYVGTLPEPKDQRNTTERATQDTNKSPNPAAQGAGAASIPTKDVEPNSYSQSYYDREDLHAQRIMAWWTRIMGIAAVIGIFLGGISIWLIWRTWDATREAAKISLQTYQAFVSLERPNIVPKLTLEHEDGESQFGINFEVTNIGKASCVVEKIYVSWTDSVDIPNFVGRAPWDAHVLVDSGSTEPIYRSWSDKRALRNGRFYSGYIVYRSPLQRDHKAYFAFEVVHITMSNDDTRTEILTCFDRVGQTKAKDT